jgi:hypothetical protein
VEAARAFTDILLRGIAADPGQTPAAARPTKSRGRGANARRPTTPSKVKISKKK